MAVMARLVSSFDLLHLVQVGVQAAPLPAAEQQAGEVDRWVLVASRFGKCGGDGPDDAGRGLGIVLRKAPGDKFAQEHCC